MSKKFFIYFYYGKDDVLLYIGKSIDVWARWVGHDEAWKNEVCKIGVLECADHAEMDILERYFIAKIPTKYNKAGLEHGYTGLEISGLKSPITYSLEEFKEKYCPRPVNKKSRTSNKATYQERLADAGYSILEVGEIVNLLDEELLQYDLDKVCLKYRDVYAIPNLPKQRRKRKNDSESEPTHRVNNVILTTKECLSNATFSIRKENNNRVFTFEFSDEDVFYEKKIGEIWNFSYLYQWNIVPDKRRTAFIGMNLMNHIIKYKDESGSCRIDVEFSKDSTEILSIDFEKNIINYNMKKIFEYCHDDKKW